MNQNGKNATQQIAVLIVDHGSRREESNQTLLAVAEMFRQAGPYDIVEAAHMELCEPTVESAFDRCVRRGATLVVVHPYFLSPGRHWDQDIPALVASAASRHPGVKYLVTAPLGAHPLMPEIISQRIEQCLRQARGEAAACELCADSDRCRIQGASEQ